MFGGKAHAFPAGREVSILVLNISSSGGPVFWRSYNLLHHAVTSLTIDGYVAIPTLSLSKCCPTVALRRTFKVSCSQLVDSHRFLDPDYSHFCRNGTFRLFFVLSTLKPEALLVDTDTIHHYFGSSG